MRAENRKLRTENQERVLRYWFGEPPLKPRGKMWWQGGDDLDREIRERFGDLVEHALAGELDNWAETPRGALAVVILLDQFMRNVYRGTAKAFAGDRRAQQIVLKAIERGLDRKLHPLERSFFYMPLEHAESPALQEKCVEQFEALVREAPAELQEYLRGNLDYAHEHRDIIARFGRFPHRNKALNRKTTNEEAEYLNSGGKRFGQ